MITPRFTITTNDRRLTVSLDALPDTLRTALRTKLRGLMATLLAQVHAAEPRRTGRLVAQTRAYINERPDFIGGRVVILSRTADAIQPFNIAAAALEYGFRHGRRRIPARRFLRGPAAAIRPRALAEIKLAIDEATTQAQRS